MKQREKGGNDGEYFIGAAAAVVWALVEALKKNNPSDTGNENDLLVSGRNSRG